jgi:hypothetical protein
MTPRVILSIFVGVLVGFYTVSFLELFSPWQPPEGVTMTDGTNYGIWVSELPASAHYFYLAIFLVSGLVGGFLTNAIARPAKDRLWWLTGFLLIVFAVGRFMAYNHPEWLTYAICIGYIGAAWLGGAIADRLPRPLFQRK